MLRFIVLFKNRTLSLETLRAIIEIRFYLPTHKVFNDEQKNNKKKRRLDHKY